MNFRKALGSAPRVLERFEGLATSVKAGGEGMPVLDRDLGGRKVRSKFVAVTTTFASGNEVGARDPALHDLERFLVQLNLAQESREVLGRSCRFQRLHAC